MNKEKIESFFDYRASHWDEEMIKNDDVINIILDGAQICSGKNILDVATGTGVLIPYYREREAGSITAIDLSGKMAEICRSKFPDVDVICGDAEIYEFGQKFDCIMIYNAFPHFPNPDTLIKHLSSFLNDGGTLTVAHGMSREKIDRCHEGAVKEISLGLMHEDELEKLFSKYLRVTVKISDDKMYQVTGTK